MTRMSRRTLLRHSATAALGLAAPAFLGRAAYAADDMIEVGALHDSSGSQAIYGKEMDDAIRFAVEEINAAGGLLGRQLNLTAFDTGSNMQNYAQFAQRLVTSQKASVVFGGVSSASREIIRPIFNRADTLYFYNTFYEGGVCDKNTFAVAETPAQMIAPAIRHLVQSKNIKRIYSMWPDYNYGYICSTWLENVAQELGAEIIAKDFFPVDVTDFSAAVTKIQQEAPDLVVSGLVGGNHMGFYRQWYAASMLGQIPVHCTVFGPWEKNLMPAEEVEGLTTCYHYYQTLAGDSNTGFVDRWHARFGENYPEIGTLAVCSYNAVNLWAKAVTEVGSLDHGSLIAKLEEGLSVDGPGGRVSIDPGSHHATMSTTLAEIRDGAFVAIDQAEDVAPLDTMAVCDLIADPDQSTQYQP